MAESLAEKKARAGEVLRLLRGEFPNATTALVHRNPFELLVATILSAQCTDARVNMVTPALFAAAPTPEKLAALPLKTIERLIGSINFFRNKSKSLSGMAKALIQDFSGEVPTRLEDLVKLPGVGRKTANVVLGSAFETPGMVVDTHVLRLSNRLRLARGLDPKKMEKELEKVFPQSDWVEAAHLFILHGRKTCAARRPLCERCQVQSLCPSAFKPADFWKRGL